MRSLVSAHVCVALTTDAATVIRQPLVLLACSPEPVVGAGSGQQHVSVSEITELAQAGHR